MVRPKSGARKRTLSTPPKVAPTESIPNTVVEDFEGENECSAEEEVDSDLEAADDGPGSDGEAVEEDHFEVEENAASLLATHFGSIVNEDSEDSGDDGWKEDAIPEPISDDEEEEEGNECPDPVNREDGEEDLMIGKCFWSASDFKHALLRYSLKSRFDIKLYISTSKKLGAVCSKKEEACPWRVYCSYEKPKRKLQIKVYEGRHTCIRSGYTKLLTSTTIAQLFEDKLRINPKYKPAEMVEEIKNKYNLIVTLDQCRKAKTKLSKARRRAHEEQFGKIWDYEAELHKTNQGTTIDIETTPGSTP